MLDLFGLLGENVAGRIRAALAAEQPSEDIEALRRENERLREEVWVFRLYGSTAMADEAMKQAALRKEEQPR